MSGPVVPNLSFGTTTDPGWAGWTVRFSLTKTLTDSELDATDAISASGRMPYPGRCPGATTVDATWLGLNAVGSKQFKKIRGFSWGNVLMPGLTYRGVGSKIHWVG